MLTIGDNLNLFATWTLDCCAIIANMLFIAAILLKTPPRLRTYSIFLLNNAIIDLLSAIASASGTVRVMQDHQGAMIYVFLGPCSLLGEWVCRASQAVQTALVNQSTIILLLSFAYRSVLQSVAPPEALSRLNVTGYTASRYFFWSTVGVILNGTVIVVSPVVFAIIFIIRHKLIAQIKKVQSIERRQHVLIARALTYQMLLPCGVSISALLFILDVTDIWTHELSERFIMMYFCLFSLASPLINFAMLPQYRVLLPFGKKQVHQGSTGAQFTISTVT